MEKTFAMIKPDAVQRGLVGAIISRYEAKGLRIAAMKIMQVTEDIAKQHYAEHVEKPFFPWSVVLYYQRPCCSSGTGR